MVAIMYLMNSIFTPEIVSSSENVMTIINFWNEKISAISVLTIGLLYHRLFTSAWEKYHKKPQGKIGQ